MKTHLQLVSLSIFPQNRHHVNSDLSESLVRQSINKKSCSLEQDLYKKNPKRSSGSLGYAMVEASGLAQGALATPLSVFALQIAFSPTPTLFAERHGNVAGWYSNLLNKKITTLL